MVVTCLPEEVQRHLNDTVILHLYCALFLLPTLGSCEIIGESEYLLSLSQWHRDKGGKSNRESLTRLALVIKRRKTTHERGGRNQEGK